MFIPLVDTLRCVNPHEETWLVASIDRLDDRDILEGVLGCPACRAEYPIHEGVVEFASVVRASFVAPRQDEALRLAAALDLVDARMTAVLQGTWGAHAPIMRGITPAHLLLVNPPAGVGTGEGISIVSSNVAPLAHGTMHAVAFDARADDVMRATLVASLRGGGRALGPASIAVPALLTEIARDDEVWVAQLDPSATTSAPILLTRRDR